MTLLNELLWNDKNGEVEKEEEKVEGMSYWCLEMCCGPVQPIHIPPRSSTGVYGCK